MKICHVVPSLEERHGGPSKSVRELAAAQARLGHTVELLATAPEPEPPRTADGVAIRVFRRDRPAALCPSAGLRAALLGADADVIHHHSLWLRTLHYARMAVPRRGGRLVLSPRGMMGAWAWRHHRLRKGLARLLVHPGAFGQASGWHATGEPEAAAIRALGFAQPVCIAPNGIAEPSPEEVRAARAHWAEACPEAVGRPVALFYSRFHRKKRLLELIDLWARAAPAGWLLLIVGIPEEYSVARLEEHARRAGGREAIRIFDGLGRPPPYPLATLFMLGSHNENFGQSIAEAMAHGVPPLVSDGTPWNRINAERIGWCVPWDDFGAALGAAAAEGPAELRRRGDRAREWVLREFSWAGPAARLAEFYASLPGRA